MESYVSREIEGLLCPHPQKQYIIKKRWDLRWTCETVRTVFLSVMLTHVFESSPDSSGSPFLWLFIVHLHHHFIYTGAAHCATSKLIAHFHEVMAHIWRC